MDDVVHRRHDPRLRLGEVEVDLSVETRGAEHSDRLLGAVRQAGYTVVTQVRARLSRPLDRTTERRQPTKGSNETTVTLMSEPLGAV